MKLANQNAVAAMDADFGEMAVRVGQHAWGLAALTMREKAFVFLAADLCAHGLGFPLQTHAAMARSRGVTLKALREATRHLAPYVGYPTSAEALMRLGEIEAAGGDEPNSAEAIPQISDRLDVDPAALQRITDLDPDFGECFREQFTDRWARPGLTIRERALCTIATDVLNGTLEESFDLHVGLALSHGACAEQVRAVLLLVAEFGIAKAWRAFRALNAIL
jgi:alkylhydroperoxidase/carboxymuconolactone decarboxylase family protein YurZ